MTVAQVAEVCWLHIEAGPWLEAAEKSLMIMFSPAHNTRLYPASKYWFNMSNLSIQIVCSNAMLKQLWRMRGFEEVHEHQHRMPLIVCVWREGWCIALGAKHRWTWTLWQIVLVSCPVGSAEIWGHERKQNAEWTKGKEMGRESQGIQVSICIREFHLSLKVIGNINWGQSIVIE